jgi:tetratricopeptide (TPR) repeat protein
MTTADRVAAMASLVPRIVELLLWPPGVNPYYGPSAFPANRAAYVVFGLLILVLALSLAAWRSRAGDRRVLAGLGAALISFLPASNLLVATGQVLAERTLYLPSVGAAMLVGLFLERVYAFATVRGVTSTGMRLAAAALGVLLLVSAIRAALFTRHWQNHDRLFARMIAADPRGYAGYWNAGVEATLQKRPAEGLAFFERAYALERRDRGLVLDLGAALTNHGRYDRAAAVYREALTLAPTDSSLNARLRALPVR